MLVAIQAAGMDMRAPFSQPVLLVERTRIAGMVNDPDKDDLRARLEIGERLKLLREPSNREDPWSIRVLSADDQLLGYIAADVNEVLARLMDAGKRLYAIVTCIDVVYSWHKVWVGVYLDD